jgi:hypothetical protein
LVEVKYVFSNLVQKHEVPPTSRINFTNEHRKSGFFNSICKSSPLKFGDNECLAIKENYYQKVID